MSEKSRKTNGKEKMLGLRQVGITKKCGRCRKWLPVADFGTRVVKDVDVVYSKCTVCRPKHAATGHTSREKAQPPAKKPKKAEPGVTSKCSWCCKVLPLADFGTHVVGGVDVVYSKCAVCRPKHAATCHTSPNHAATVAKHDRSDKGRARHKRYQTSDKGKAIAKRSRCSEKGQARAKRALAVCKARRKADPAYAMMGNIKRAASKLVKGKHETSPTFVARTGFASETSFLAHMRSEAAKIGCSMSDYGRRRWEMEHKIPVEAYDFRNPVNIKRCWSRANLHAMPPKENKEKAIQILDDLVREIDPAFWPLSWEGKMPTADEKQAFYAQAKAAWQPYEAAGYDSDDEEDDEDDEEDEEDEEDDDDEEDSDSI